MLAINMVVGLKVRVKKMINPSYNYREGEEKILTFRAEPQYIGRRIRKDEGYGDEYISFCAINTRKNATEGSFGFCKFIEPWELTENVED